jgi:hypothetical protein
MQTYDAHKSTTEARQGSRRRLNLRVLIWSTMAVIIAFALVYLFFFVFNSPPPNTTTGV